nr:hypothetical protein [Tanacetum cinerariifolium]
KIPRECLAIIESKFKVRYSRNKPVVAKVSTNTSTSSISPDVAELKDMVKALLLDQKSQNQSPAPVKAVEESCVTCGGAHSYRKCPAADGNVYRDNIQEFVSQASAVNYNQGNISYRPPMMPNQIRPPGYQAPAYQAPAPQTQGVSKEDFSAYDKANDAVMRNMQTQGQNMQNQLTNLTDLITKFVNSYSASTSSSGTLPSNTIANRYFNKITSTLKFSNVPNTSIKLMLFPFSLEDKIPRECLAIIESKFKVRYSRNKPVVAKVSTNTSTSSISPDVAELKDMVKALLLDQKSQNQSPAPVKAVEESCVTCGGAHSYRKCPAADGNVYRDNIQ